MKKIILLILAIGVIGGTLWWIYVSTQPILVKDIDKKLYEDTFSKDSDSTEVISPTDDDTNITSNIPEGYIAGKESQLLEISEENYNQELNSNRLVVLYFYANWCPICQAEFKDTINSFNQINNPNVIGFRVNYNDNETTDFERSLASQFGVAYQHTKVFVRNGTQILKAPDSWSVDRYISEINDYSNS